MTIEQLQAKYLPNATAEEKEAFKQEMYKSAGFPYTPAKSEADQVAEAIQAWGKGEILPGQYEREIKLPKEAAVLASIKEWGKQRA